jgi:hypothetical protein
MLDMTVESVRRMALVLVSLGVTVATTAAGWAFDPGRASGPAAASPGAVTEGQAPASSSSRVGAGDNLQAVLDAARPGDELRIDPHAVFSGNFVVRASGTEDKPIVIRPDGPLPERRITPDDRDALFTLAVGSNAATEVLRFADGVHDVQVVGMRVQPNTADPSRTLVSIGRQGKAVTTLDTMPQRITLDRCLIQGDPTKGGRRGVAIAARQVVISRSWISDFVYSGRDSQAVWIFAGQGIVVNDNQLEASGENLLVGGADVGAEAVMPQDIAITGNTIFKPAYYKSRAGSVKNSLELKVGLRVRIERNIIDGCWKDAQPGSAVLLTTRNQERTAPWSQIRDVVIRGNIVRNDEASAWLNILSLDDTLQADKATLVPSRELTNLLVEHNLATNITNGVRIGYGGRDFVFRHNTMLGVKNWMLQFHGSKDAATGKVRPVVNLTWTGNVSASGDYGITSDYGLTIGAATLAGAATGVVWEHNVVELSPARAVGWPAGTTTLAAGTLAEQVDASTGTFKSGSALAKVKTGDRGSVGVDPGQLPRESR